MRRSGLARRYKETRRKHPLAAENGGSVTRAIQAERARFCLSAAAHRLSDRYLPSVPRPAPERIAQLFLADTAGAMMVQCMSFGFKYGYPRRPIW